MNINKDPGCYAATVGISTVVTAGFGWPEVLLGWCLAAVLRWLLSVKSKDLYNNSGRMSVWILMTVGAFLISGTLLAAEKAFPEDGTFPFVSLGLLLLLYRSLIGERETGAMVSNVLGLVLLGLFGVIELFGFANVTWREMIPQGFQWTHTWIILAVTSPWWAAKDEGGGWGWFGLGAVSTVGMSLLCRGILGAALTEYSGLPFYCAVQTIHLLGSLQRLEALLAAAVLLGTFAMLTQIGEVVRNAARIVMPKVSNRKWAAGLLVISYGIEHIYIITSESYKNWIDPVFWGVVPIFALWVVFSQKMKKVLDKRGWVE